MGIITIILKAWYLLLIFGARKISVCVDDAKSLLSAVSDASTRVNLSSYIVNGFCRKYAN